MSELTDFSWFRLCRLLFLTQPKLSSGEPVDVAQIKTGTTAHETGNAVKEPHGVVGGNLLQ